MMQQITIKIPETDFRSIAAHLLHPDGCENAAFAFCRCAADEPDAEFTCVEWLAVPPDGCAARSAYYLQLTDEMRTRVIKRAHDLQVSLVELHSHRSSFPAEFSPSDFSGFDEFVPHVWWRLKGRPFAAIVVAESSFDGIAWMQDANSPQPVAAIKTGAELLRPTGISLREQMNER